MSHAPKSSSSSSESRTESAAALEGTGSDLHAIDPRSGGVVDRRLGLDRRRTEGSSPTNLERRRGRGRRLTEFVKSAEEGEMNPEQFLFLLSIDALKRSGGSSFPTWERVLEVVRGLGYRKTAASELNLGGRVRDWTEAANATPDRSAADAADEIVLFLLAVDAFKRANGKTFPTWTDVLEIIRKLGYRKTVASTLPIDGRAQDWTEKPDSPSGVWKAAPSESSSASARRLAG
jgi:hypothetical protein